MSAEAFGLHGTVQPKCGHFRHNAMSPDAPSVPLSAPSFGSRLAIQN